MPKKAPKNAFYYFMLDFKDEQQKKGINYGNLAEVSKAADPEWRNASSSVRTKYDQLAKQKRRDHNFAPEEKFTSNGEPLSAVQRRLREEQESEEFEKKDIKNMIKLKAFYNKEILEEYFYVIDVNAYCKADTGFVIGECTVLRFSLKSGFQDFYHVPVNPGRIPIGYASDVKIGCQEYGLEMPDEASNRSNYMQILAYIIDYLKHDRQAGQNVKSLPLPPLYTMPDKRLAVQDFILQLCDDAGENPDLFRIYRLDTLFFTLINAIKSGAHEGFPKESLALSLLKKDVFMYSPGLGCEHHESIDKSMECTTSRTKRWAYTILDSCCPLVGIEVKPGLHVPGDYDMKGILNFKDAKKVRPGPSVAGVTPATSSCNTTLNESFKDVSFANSSTASGSEIPRKEKRTYAPMRMPRADYSKDIHPAPELTEDNFPTLSTGAGRGRGSLPGSFNKLNIGNKK